MSKPNYHEFKLTAIILDPRFQQTGSFQQESAEALQIILEERFKQMRGLLVKVSDVKVRPLLIPETPPEQPFCETCGKRTIISTKLTTWATGTGTSRMDRTIHRIEYDTREKSYERDQDSLD